MLMFDIKLIQILAMHLEVRPKKSSIVTILNPCFLPNTTQAKYEVSTFQHPYACTITNE